ncbi:hypothetical protein CQW23_12028 [Capsicum baccatum]|uniref:Ubiquitin-like protease family profile domain-containing protein n=1 Tax=Capsicum baccatum TaxID=33114 RepID=A0A2G2WRL3_CAPBA|nr:hypothetical protein CQW23_12028 [Capsicum baccatum]
MTSKRGVIPSKRISYPETPLEIKKAKRRRKYTSKASSSIKKSKIRMPLSLSCTDVQCARAIGEQHGLKKVDVTVEVTAEEHNITVNNPSTTSKEEEKHIDVIFYYLRKKVKLQIQEQYRYTTDNCLYKVYINNAYDRYCQQQLEVSRNEEFLINIIKERHIQVFDSMSRKRCSGSSSEIQKLAKILPTYLDMSGFLDQKVRTDWSTIEVYRDKMSNPFDVQYVEAIAQQTIGSLDCDFFVATYVEYLSDGLQVPNDGIDVRLLRKRYAALLLKYGEVKAQKPYATNVKDLRRSKPNFVAPNEEQLVHIRSL